jgi:hypothetical protein
VNSDHHIETQRSFWCLHSSCLLLKKMFEAFSSVTTLECTKVCASWRPSQVFDG